MPPRPRIDDDCAASADMDNYNELVRLVHGKEQALFF